FPFPTAAPTPTPPRTKHKLVIEGKKLTFRCGKKIASKKGNVYWYKDGELLEHSHPNYISLKEDHITIVANAINEGTYTCIVKKKDKVLTNYSWKSPDLNPTAPLGCGGIGDSNPGPAVLS
ncbi:Matrix metalloproteinase-23, partial [Characodon lateralis]|nr:Matrix metalloproteinase-23 [Characodon lateralis]